MEGAAARRWVRAIYAKQGMSEPRGRLAQCSVSLHAVLAASLGAHRKAQHARVCFAGGRYFSKQRQLRESRCSARSAKRLAESTLGNCMLGFWLCPSRIRAPRGKPGAAPAVKEPITGAVILPSDTG